MGVLSKFGTTAFKGIIKIRHSLETIMPNFSKAFISKQAIHHVMILPCMVSLKLNQKLSILDVKFFIQMHDGNCPSILYE
jgi:hypothetical protein